MIRENENQNTTVEVKPVIELGSVWIDESHESLFHVRVALESQNIADAVGICISKYRGKFLSVDADSIINPERHKKIWPLPDVNAEMLAALNQISVIARSLALALDGESRATDDSLAEIRKLAQDVTAKAKGGPQ